MTSCHVVGFSDVSAVRLIPRHSRVERDVLVLSRFDSFREQDRLHLLIKYLDMKQISLWVVILFASLCAHSKVHANVEYACGTKVGAGSFYSETGRMICEDEVGNAEKQIKADDKAEIFCLYQATCTPITPKIRQVLTIAANGKNWSELTDDDINQIMLGYLGEIQRDAVRNLRKIPFEVHDHAVQCLGTKTDDKPNCPSVNDCINNRKNASTFWKIQPYNPPFKATPADSKGFRMRDQGTSIPKLQETIRK